MAISDWPAETRPREKLLAEGPAALADAELLAIFLRTGVTGLSAVDLAQQLLERFGSLRALMTASQKEFCSALGLGDAKYAQLQAVMEMSRRHIEEQLYRDDALETPQACKNYLTLQLRDEPHELFAILLLDARHRPLGFEILFRGTINATAVYPREVVKATLAHNAAAVILAHNHPSGIAEPSRADEHLTTRLSEALRLIDVRVLDHFVVGDGVVTSFAERGLI